MSETAKKIRDNIITGTLRMTRQVFYACWSTILLAGIVPFTLQLTAELTCVPALQMFDSSPTAAALAAMSAGIGIGLWLLWAYLFLCFLATAKCSVAWDALARGKRLTAKEVSADVRMHRRPLRQLATRVLAKSLWQITLILAIAGGVAACGLAMGIIIEGTTDFEFEAIGEVAVSVGLLGMLVMFALCWLKIRVDTALAPIFVVRGLSDPQIALAVARLWVTGRRLRFFFAQAGLYVLGSIVTATGICAVVAPALLLNVLGLTPSDPANLRLAAIIGLSGLLAASMILVQVVTKVAVSLVPVSATVHWPPPKTPDGPALVSSRAAQAYLYGSRSAGSGLSPPGA